MNFQVHLFESNYTHVHLFDHENSKTKMAQHVEKEENSSVLLVQ